MGEVELDYLVEEGFSGVDLNGDGLDISLDEEVELVVLFLGGHVEQS